MDGPSSPPRWFRVGFWLLIITCTAVLLSNIALLAGGGCG